MSKNIENTLGLKIKAIRKEFNYYQSELAEKINSYYIKIKSKKGLNKNVHFTQVDISQMESNSSGVGQYKTMLLITYFYDIHEVSPEYFFIKNKKINKLNPYGQSFMKSIDQRIKKYDSDNKKLISNLKKDLVSLIKNPT